MVSQYSVNLTLSCFPVAYKRANRVQPGNDYYIGKPKLFQEKLWSEECSQLVQSPHQHCTIKRWYKAQLVAITSLKGPHPFSRPTRSSGAMNAGDPTKVFRLSSFAKPSAGQLNCLSSFAATPKSLSLTVPSRPTRMLLACK